jgi:hypothetical protein
MAIMLKHHTATIFFVVKHPLTNVLHENITDDVCGFGFFDEID